MSKLSQFPDRSGWPLDWYKLKRSKQPRPRTPREWRTIALLRLAAVWIAVALLSVGLYFATHMWMWK